MVRSTDCDSVGCGFESRLLPRSNERKVGKMTIIEALTDLQEVDGRIRELEVELKDLPRRKAQEMARLSGVSADLAAAKANEEYANGRVQGLESDIQALKDKIAELKRTQMGLKTNKEYQDFSIQIDLVSHDLETTENNQLAAMDEIPSAKARIDEAQSKYDSAKGVVDSFCAEIDERIALVKTELDAAQKERAEKAKLVDNPKFLLYYERLRTKRWPVVVPLTHDGVCDGCHLVQPPSVGQLADANARNGEQGKPQSIVACTMCGRMLYRS